MSNTTIHNTNETPFVDLVSTTNRLVAVWAHPDDESFLGAGFMQAVAAKGGEVTNVTATWGELGTDNPTLWPPERLARLRKAELTKALDLLGGAAIEHLGIRDGSCETLDDRLGARIVGTVIERNRPDAIVTFGPDGVTGHPDHQAISRWTHLAADAVDPSIPVFSVVSASAWPNDLIEPLNDVGAFFPGYPDQSADQSDLLVSLGPEELDIKLEALDAHASQMGPLRDRLGPVDYRRLFAVEAYRPSNAAAVMTVEAGDRHLAPVA